MTEPSVLYDESIRVSCDTSLMDLNRYGCSTGGLNSTSDEDVDKVLDSSAPGFASLTE